MTETIKRSDIPARSRDALSTETDDVTILMSMASGRFVELNPTARAIWDLTDGRASVDDIIAHLAGKFAVTPEECAADVAEVYGKLEAEGLIILQN